MVRLPLISLRVTCNCKRYTFWALIDSRAESSVFSKEVAEILDVDIPAGNPFLLNGVDGAEISTWDHQVNIAVDGLGSIDTIAAFTNSDNPELPILGQRGFFDNYQIRFQRYKNTIELWPKSTSM